MRLTLIDPPAAEPVSLPDLKTQCRVEQEVVVDDDYITGLGLAARLYVEKVQRRAFVEQTWKLTLDDFPCVTSWNPWAKIDLPFPPLRSVSSPRTRG